MTRNRARSDGYGRCGGWECSGRGGIAAACEADTTLERRRCRGNRAARGSMRTPYIWSTDVRALSAGWQTDGDLDPARASLTMTS